MRIIAGCWRGRRVSFEQSKADLRPTGDRIRETLFNWLDPYIRDARCLDMFAGTGVLGLEALSRGAAGVIFIEKDPEVARQLEQNLHKLEAEHGRVLQGDAVDRLKTVGSPVHIVFLDPPFAGTDYANLCTLLEQSGCLAEEALIYIEMPRKSDWPDLPANWEIRKEKTAGQVRYALLARQ